MQASPSQQRPGLSGPTNDLELIELLGDRDMVGTEACTYTCACFYSLGCRTCSPCVCMLPTMKQALRSELHALEQVLTGTAPPQHKGLQAPANSSPLPAGQPQPVAMRAAGGQVSSRQQPPPASTGALAQLPQVRAPGPATDVQVQQQGVTTPQQSPRQQGTYQLSPQPEEREAAGKPLASPVPEVRTASVGSKAGQVRPGGALASKAQQQQQQPAEPVTPHVAAGQGSPLSQLHLAQRKPQDSTRRSVHPAPVPGSKAASAAAGSQLQPPTSSAAKAERWQVAGSRPPATSQGSDTGTAGVRPPAGQAEIATAATEAAQAVDAVALLRQARKPAPEDPDPRVRALVAMYQRSVHSRDVLKQRQQHEREQEQQQEVQECTFSPSITERSRRLVSRAASPPAVVPGLALSPGAGATSSTAWLWRRSSFESPNRSDRPSAPSFSMTPGPAWPQRRLQDVWAGLDDGDDSPTVSRSVPGTPAMALLRSFGRDASPPPGREPEFGQRLYGAALNTRATLEAKLKQAIEEERQARRFTARPVK